MIRHILSFVFLFFFFPSFVGAQNQIKLLVLDESAPIPSASISLQGLEKSYTALTNEQGQATFSNLREGIYQLEIRHLSYLTHKDTLSVSGTENLELSFTLKPDQLQLETAVVTGTRSAVPIYDAPVMVNKIGKRTFEQTQAISLSEGLNFSPGLRVENNCQNCGFIQLRMNGLDGAYSQILINSRPVFSALAGVYGLELIPTTMVERIEVVKGGGSVLYGGNAIAGTVNIITMEPVENQFQLGLNQAFTNSDEPDRTLNFSGSMVSKDLSSGISFYGFNRERDPWDANGDGFSELTQLANTTLGIDAFWNPSLYSKIKLHAYGIDEFRRGGNGFDLAPHQTDITEQLDHRIWGASTSFEVFSTNYLHKFSVYGGAQRTLRDSYYGGGGRILEPGGTFTEDDLLAINAYGQSEDLALNGGVQYTYEPNKQWILTAGSEYQYNDVLDEMPGYLRNINQRIGSFGNYAQLQFQPSERWTLLAGGRYDIIQIDGQYDLAQERFSNKQNLQVFVPRLSAKYDLSQEISLRASFAEGYRAPQAFDEDLHIEVVGGAALFIQLDPSIQTERSQSWTASLNWNRMQSAIQSNLVIEAFYTNLSNPFILSDQRELGSGVGVIRKRNGDGARVQGINLEANVAIGRKTVIQAGGTLQQALFNEQEVLWEGNQDGVEQVIATDRLLRNPNVYGFMSLVHNPSKAWELSWSAIYTGSMDVAHVIDPETEFTVIEETPSFFEQNLKATYEIPSLQGMELFAGVQNVFNAFQSDFDLGIDRDAGYVYGPTRPRTIYGGIKYSFR